jgi:hypothetical protein
VNKEKIILKEEKEHKPIAIVKRLRNTSTFVSPKQRTK